MNEIAEFWGRLYEVLVKRGILTYLQQTAEVTPPPDWPGGMTLRDLAAKLRDAFAVTDPDSAEIVQAGVSHLAAYAYGQGQTVMQAFWKSRQGPAAAPEVIGLWCPFEAAFAPHPQAAVQARKQRFAEVWGFPVARDEWFGQGKCGNADFLLWLRQGKRHRFLVLEFSFDAVAPYRRLADFRDQRTALAELRAIAIKRQLRGVYSYITTEFGAPQEKFHFADALIKFLPAFASADKPLVKLAQAAAYLRHFVTVLRREGRLGSNEPLQATLLAVTPSGLEGFSCAWQGEAMPPVLRHFAEVYERYPRDRSAPLEVSQGLWRTLIVALPRAIAQSLKAYQAPAEEDLCVTASETRTDFINPGQVCDWTQLERWIPQDAPKAWQERLCAQLKRWNEEGRIEPTLRTLHAAAIVSALEALPPGNIEVLALEGNPGIGKTTAVRQYLLADERPFLFLYFSPRVLINRDLFQQFAAPGVLTLTTDEDTLHKAPVNTERRYEGAVVYQGEFGAPPEGNVYFIPAEVAEAEERRRSSQNVRSVSDEESRISRRQVLGVLRALATGACLWWQHVPTLRRLVLTAAVQSYKLVGAGDTIDGLKRMFVQQNPLTPAGKNERRALAERFGRIVLMVDEVSGSPEGVPLVHALLRWLHAQFVEPFDEPLPCRLAVIVADASLTHRQAWETYLSQPQSPDRARSVVAWSTEPFALHEDDLTLPQLPTGRLPVRHVLTNAFPASELKIEYQLRTRQVLWDQAEQVMPRIKKAYGEANLEELARYIARWRQQHETGQLIVFLQDKQFLRNLRDLVLESDSAFSAEEIQILDHQTDDPTRRRLLQPQHRDKVRVFLMTSSGARGISFPRATHLLVVVPRFAPEAQLMEIAQLIYRGRGASTLPDGTRFDGDRLPRTLTFWIDDYFVRDPKEADAERRARWWRHVIDLLTFLVLLRATVLTRITGDAGLARQRLAVVPVGRTLAERMQSYLAPPVREFIKNCELARTSAVLSQHRALLSKAASLARKIFTHYHILLQLRRAAGALQGFSWVKEDGPQRYWNAVANANMPLLPRSAPLLSTSQQVLGPVVFEDLTGVIADDHFFWSAADPQKRQEVKQLLNLCHILAKAPYLSKDLKRLAGELAEWLKQVVKQMDAHDKSQRARAVHIGNPWVAMPVDQTPWLDATEQRKCLVLEAESWRDILAQWFDAYSHAAPALPHYEGRPWVSVLAERDPLRLEQVFDPRYFAASSELNLLNLVLLEPEEMPGS